jgi:hypothetical protein
MAASGDPLAIRLTPERLLAYADTWRRLARTWTEMAADSEPELAEQFRRAAHAALRAAHEADELLKGRVRAPTESGKPSEGETTVRVMDLDARWGLEVLRQRVAAAIEESRELCALSARAVDEWRRLRSYAMKSTTSN